MALCSFLRTCKAWYLHWWACLASTGFRLVLFCQIANMLIVLNIKPVCLYEQALRAYPDLLVVVLCGQTSCFKIRAFTQSHWCKSWKHFRFMMFTSLWCENVVWVMLSTRRWSLPSFFLSVSCSELTPVLCTLAPLISVSVVLILTGFSRSPFSNSCLLARGSVKTSGS